MNNKFLERVVFLLIYLVGLFFVFQWFGHSILLGNPIDLLVFSGLAALAINILLLSVFFDSPKDVIASSLNALILLISLSFVSNFSHFLLIGLIIYVSICLLLSVVSVMLYNPEENAGSMKQRLSTFLKEIVVSIGAARVLFSILIASILIHIYSNEGIVFYVFVCMGLVLLVNEPIRQAFISVFSLVKSLFIKRKIDRPDPIGHIVAVQAKDIFIVDLIDINKRPPLNLFDFIEFKYGADSHYIRGFIVDRYYLDSQTKIKVLRTSSQVINSNNKKEYSAYENNVAYKVKTPTKDEQNILERFVGTVIEHSDMKQVNFEYSSKKMLSNGDLLVIEAKDKDEKTVNVLYQVTQAYTNIKILENRNEIGLIQTKAAQLGVWREVERNFENYGWVSPISTSVMLANNVKGPDKQDGEIALGTIEDTDFNVLVNIKDFVTHHTAILGTTGTGKSVFARKLIGHLKDSDIKIFCIDLTGDTRKYLNHQELVDTKEIISASEIVHDTKGNPNGTVKTNKKFYEHLTYYTDLQESHYGRTPKEARILAGEIENHIKLKLQDFINSNTNNIGLLELSELSNTAETLEYTKIFFKVLFDLAKDGVFRQNRACIMMEEAHTLIPEWNAVGGTDDKTAKKLTNTIAQIALQGRKYNVGLFVIAQRTANVSKTILTQCNTIISFKQFDNTSKDFLINHFGDSFIDSLSMLKNRRAIIAGKALVSDVPIIFKVPEIEEKEIIQTVVGTEKNIIIGETGNP